MLKHPKFAYIDYKKKVYLIAQKDTKFPLCEGKCKYYTIPIQLSNYTTYQNVLVGYTNSLQCNKIVNETDNCVLQCVTCKEAKSLAEMLSIPLAIIINNEDNQIFYVPTRK